MPFDNTTAIVTGGAQGLGLAIAEALAARGTKVAIFDLATDQTTAEVADVDALPAAVGLAAVRQQCDPQVTGHVSGL